MEATTDLGMSSFSIPYNGWECIGPFVTDASSEVATIATSWDEKQGIVEFSNSRMSFFKCFFYAPYVVLTNPVVIV